MKAIATMAAAAALIGLAGCDRLGLAGDSASSDKAGTRAPRERAPGAGKARETGGGNNGAGVAPAQPGLGGRPVPGTVQAAATLAVPALDRAFLIGRWTDSRDCREAGAFTADGQYVNAAGVAALWVLEGDRLVMTFAGAAPRELRVAALDQNTLTVINPDGSLGRSTRC